MKKSIKFVAIIMAAIIAIGAFAPAAVAATEIRVTLNGESVDFGSDSPIIIDNTTYVPRQFIAGLLGSKTPLPDTDMLPLRATLEPFGYTLTWDGATRTAHIHFVPQEEINATTGAYDAVTAFMENLVAGNYAAATAMLSPAAQAAVQLIPLQMHMAGRHGAMLDFAILGGMDADGAYVATVSATHTKGPAVHQFIVDENGTIAGFAPISFTFEPMMPPANASYTAETVVIGEGSSWALDGLLTIPADASAENPVPAVMLVHGSGANNMDSSLFENRPFFDIADYLSANGIAVLRYNERAFSHAVQQVFGTDFTVWEEYVEDAILAAALLRADERIDQVFVLGLSQGGLMAPRLAEEAALDGVIVMNGSPRPLYHVSHSQSVQAIYDALTAGFISQEDADTMLSALAALLEEANHMMTLPADELQDMLVLGALPALYQKSVVDSLPLPFIAASPDRPVLILQGSRDFQVTVEVDFQMFLDGTEGMAHVTTILYEGLNHLMMTAYRQEGPLVIDVMEYAIPGRVDAQVLRDIVDWILGE